MMGCRMPGTSRDVLAVTWHGNCLPISLSPMLRLAGLRESPDS